MKNQICPAPTKNEQKMNSIHISKISGKNHRDVMRAIRNMEPAWEKINGRNFALVEYVDQKGQKRPMYELDWKECMFIGSKFDDEARARIIIEWTELRDKELNRKQLSEKASYVENVIYPCKLGDGMVHCYNKNKIVYVKLSTLFTFLGASRGFHSYMIDKLGEENLIQVPLGKNLLWFGNYESFKQYLKYYTPTSFKKINAAARDIWGVDYSSNPDDPYVYHFTSMQILEIFELIFESPINKNKVIQKLGHGKMEGGY